ncbi:Hnt1p [Sugiyamaella lignohabitans]|uniref:Hnt1p n=1 Tax=Sugiyamaella lignohabitans TaxID=796027 RepID=A0A167CSN5_9ASCO|nr:Hnt1p [Sugiyamaella lignohabitans]ANB12061.1 Hnt1p [Sugiyamaella lignohabitans]
MFSEECPFCDIAASNRPGSLESTSTVFYSTEHVLAFLDIQPLVSSAAHVLVTSRKHYKTLDELASDPDTSAALGIALAKVSKALKTQFGAEAFNIVQNNGSAAGQVVPHVHFHVVIRKQQTNPPSTLPKSADLMKTLLSAPSYDSLDFKTKMAYSSLIFGRGTRQDLDDSWAATLVPQLRTALSSPKL